VTLQSTSDHCTLKHPFRAFKTYSSFLIVVHSLGAAVLQDIIICCHSHWSLLLFSSLFHWFACKRRWTKYSHECSHRSKWYVCPRCSSEMERKLGKLERVMEVKADYRSYVIVKFLENQTSVEEMCAEIRRLGYTGRGCTWWRRLSYYTPEDVLIMRICSECFKEGSRRNGNGIWNRRIEVNSWEEAVSNGFLRLLLSKSTA